MKVSLRTKFLAVCVLLVLLTTAGLSTTYYTFTRQDQRIESQQRIQIAFDFILSDFSDRLENYQQRVEEFLQKDAALRFSTSAYISDPTQLKSLSFLTTYLKDAADELQQFGQGIQANRLVVFGADGRLLFLYERQQENERLGVYLVSQTGNDTYLPMEDREALGRILVGAPVPENPLPAEISAQYPGDLPETLTARIMGDGRLLGIRVLAPILHRGQITGVLLSDFLFTQSVVERYAAFSKTDINLFVNEQFGMGTLPAQNQLAPGALTLMPACEDILDHSAPLAVLPVTYAEHEYYQGQCALKNKDEAIGAVTISLSQDREKAKIRKMLIAVLEVSAISLGAAFFLSFLLSRRAIHSIQNIVKVIGVVAEGDLRKTAKTVTHDEIGMLGLHLNQMVQQLRGLYGQVQQAARTVNTTSEAILEEMHTLTGRMEQQTTTVDNTTDFVERINQFILDIGQSTTEQRITAEQVLSSIQEIRASIEEVTDSTTQLAASSQDIGTSIEQVNQSVRHISESAELLMVAVQETETEIHHIDQSVKDVSQNAVRSQELAKDTMDAVQRGQFSVDASIQGMLDLKSVVSQSAQIIQEVNTSSAQISSILDIVDDIAEQTSLLSLNAAIISAQAGEHGRGFAVVASEIKDLAQRTKSSTKEINTLIRSLQTKTADSVMSISEGIHKADQGVNLVSAVKDDLHTILDKATRTSSMATDTVNLARQTTESSQAIKSSMNMLTDMVANITNAIQEQEQDISQIVATVEKMREMSAQVNQANREQNKAATQIVKGMEYMAARLSDISSQAGELKNSSQQIVAAMRTIEAISKNVLVEAISISGSTADNMAHQAEVLGQIVTVFKVP